MRHSGSAHQEWNLTSTKRGLYYVRDANLVSLAKMENRASNVRQALSAKIGEKYALSAQSEHTPRKERKNAKIANLETTVQTLAG